MLPYFNKRACIFMPQPPLGGAGNIMFSCRPFVRPSVCDVVSAMSPLCIDGFSPNFCQCAPCDKDELIRFWVINQNQRSRYQHEDAC